MVAVWHFNWEIAINPIRDARVPEISSSPKILLVDYKEYSWLLLRPFTAKRVFYKNFINVNLLRINFHSNCSEFNCSIRNKKDRLLYFPSNQNLKLKICSIHKNLNFIDLLSEKRTSNIWVLISSFILID